MITWLVIVLACACFIINFVVHLFLWRFKRPRREVLALFLIFLTGPIFLSLGLRGARIFEWNEAFQALSLAMVLGSLYVMCYPAAQADSPSLQFLRFLKLFPQGIAEADFICEFDRASLKSDRTADLQREGWVEGNRPVGVGLFLARFFHKIRKLLALRSVG